MMDHEAFHCRKYLLTTAEVVGSKDAAKSEKDPISSCASESTSIPGIFKAFAKMCGFSDPDIYFFKVLEEIL